MDIDSQGSLIHVVVKVQQCGLTQLDKLLLIERCQNRQCITV